jgi:hypothetical protein
MLALTDFNAGSPIRNELGWSLLIIVMFAVAINLIKAIIFDIKNLIKWIIKKCKERNE